MCGCIACLRSPVAKRGRTGTGLTQWDVVTYLLENPHQPASLTSNPHTGGMRDYKKFPLDCGRLLSGSFQAYPVLLTFLTLL